MWGMIRMQHPLSVWQLAKVVAEEKCFDWKLASQRLLWNSAFSTIRTAISPHILLGASALMVLHFAQFMFPSLALSFCPECCREQFRGGERWTEGNKRKSGVWCRLTEWRLTSTFCLAKPLLITSGLRVSTDVSDMNKRFQSAAVTFNWYVIGLCLSFHRGRHFISCNPAAKQGGLWHLIQYWFYFSCFTAFLLAAMGVSAAPQGSGLI